MRCRLRGPDGVTTLEISDTATIAELRHGISQKTGISSFDLKLGYPPQPVDLEQLPADSLVSASELKLNGQQLLISTKQMADGTGRALSQLPSQFSKDETSSPQASWAPAPSGLTRKSQVQDIAQDPPEIYVPSADLTVLLRVMPDDNSCLFRAIALAAEKDMGEGAVTQLRFQVAEYIKANPDQYNAAILEKEPLRYCAWIQQESSWGGYIECAILSQILGVEICSVDVETGNVQKYNEGFGYERIVIIYSGIHYDTMVTSLAPSMGPEIDQSRFQPGDDTVLVYAQQLCAKLNEMGYSTNTSTFSVLCNVCKQSGAGEKWAARHAKETGHGDFGET